MHYNFSSFIVLSLCDLILYRSHGNSAWTEVRLVSISKAVIVPVREECLCVSGIKLREGLQGGPEKEV